MSSLALNGISETEPTIQQSSVAHLQDLLVDEVSEWRPQNFPDGQAPRWIRTLRTKLFRVKQVELRNLVTFPRRLVPFLSLHWLEDNLSRYQTVPAYNPM